MAKKLVIVESPTKARTLSEFLGRDYNLFATTGHIRDLPKSNLGVEVEKDFAPRYVIPAKSRKIVSELRKKAAQGGEIFIATDEDREGEAIGWHVLELLGLSPAEVRRVAFHEITKRAVEEAFRHPRQLDLNLVDAQQTRRILDRLVGYHLSPLLWKKIFRGLSAGRVQSAALRLIIKRAREREAFKPETYFTVQGSFQSERKEKFSGELIRYQKEKGKIRDEALLSHLLKSLPKASFKVVDFNEKEKEHLPYPPFTTSTLQQTASSLLRFPVKKTMILAQMLYEGVEIDGKRLGLITYMRTDSPHLSPLAISEMRRTIAKEFGSKYLSAKPRQYAAQSKRAQEAHEAIRPTHPHLTPEKLKTSLTPDQWKLYNLIWNRALATQMAALQTLVRQAKIEGGGASFLAQGVKIVFDGFTKILPRKIEAGEMPVLKTNEAIQLLKLTSEEHTSEPPPLYSEGSLVKAMERLGIGRPSTYAPTISTIISRGYVKREKGYLHPQEVGFLVDDFLTQHFPEIVDFKFTAEMERKLDEVAEGKNKMVPILKAFFGPFSERLKKTEEKAEKIKGEEINEKCPECGGPLVTKFGRFGKFIACSNFPTCRYTRNINGGNSQNSAPAEKIAELCPICGSPMVMREGRFGRFLGCSRFPECQGMKRITNLSLGRRCPRCREGELLLRQDRKRKRIFYGCSRFPECQFAARERPMSTPCPTCRGVMVWSNKKGYAVCQDCGYEDKNKEVGE